MKETEGQSNKSTLHLSNLMYKCPKLIRSCHFHSY